MKQYEYIELSQLHIKCSSEQQKEIKSLKAGFVFSGRQDSSEAAEGDLKQLQALGSIGFKIACVYPGMNCRKTYLLERVCEK